MDTTEIRVGKTIDEATKFAFRNLLSTIQVGWLPIGLTIAIASAIAWVFWEPIILTYIDFFEAYSAAGTDADALEQVMEVFAIQFANALEEIGLGGFLFGYVLFVAVTLFGYAIPITAYCRMMVLDERYPAPFYLRFGPREISVGLTYLAITVIGVVAITGLMFGVVLISALASSGGEPSPISALLGFGGAVFCIWLSLWLFGRLLVALPVSAVEGGVPVGRAWTLTKGMGGKLAWILLLGYLVLTVLSLIFMMILSMVTGLILGILTGLGSQLAPYFVGAAWFIGYVAFYCFSTAFFMALFALPYKRLMEGSA